MLVGDGGSITGLGGGGAWGSGPIGMVGYWKEPSFLYANPALLLCEERVHCFHYQNQTTTN